MSDEVKVTKCPPGVARGAYDLQRWAQRRVVGRSGADDPYYQKEAVDRYAKRAAKAVRRVERIKTRNKAKYEADLERFNADSSKSQLIPAKDRNSWDHGVSTDMDLIVAKSLGDYGPRIEYESTKPPWED